MVISISDKALTRAALAGLGVTFAVGFGIAAKDIAAGKYTKGIVNAAILTVGVVKLFNDAKNLHSLTSE